MNFKIDLFIVLFSSLCLFSCGIKKTNLSQETAHSTKFNQLSELFIQNQKEGLPTGAIKKELAEASLAILSKSLDTDAKRYAFWINIYNAYIYEILSRDSLAYNHRNEFFSKPQVPIAGAIVSFSTIEHGIIRQSQMTYGLGYFSKWFPSDFEKKLRVENRDYRVHFALNCGAKDCPPVAIYTPQQLEDQFTMATVKYIKETSEYNISEGTVKVSALFSWFRGDFGGQAGTKEILMENRIISGTDVTIKYKAYDWTLFLGNYINI